MTGKRVHALPTPSEVRAQVRFDGQDFYWLPRPLEAFSLDVWGRRWNRQFAGKKITIKRSNRYDAIRINGVLFMAHRLIWLFEYGEWPKGEIDHINGDRLDNRISNLRDVTKSENMRNQKLRSDSTSGCPGVHFCKDKGKRPWAARIGRNNTWKTLGYFATREEAIECRKREQGAYGFSDRHGVAA